MPIRDALLPEFDHEMATTRRLLERVPEEKAAWKPHPKSFSLGDLSVHIANLLTWLAMTLDRTELDLSPPGGEAFKSPRFESTSQLLATFDEGVRKARAALAEVSDEDLRVPWTLKNAGTEIFTMPRVVTLRSFVFNHLIHHRGQLSVYLRLNDVPLPSIYGPTADES
ncbi:MAG TPA: DinB family protein [Thermoanaerobaculia bacterium]